MPAISVWLQAARLRTLPLALSSVGMGMGLAVVRCERISWLQSLLILVTTVALQILSNFANDYGDSVHGADNAERQGPARMIQSGAISPRSMMWAIGIAGLTALSSGLILLYVSLGYNRYFFLFLLLGLWAIWAAYYYTAGRKPYGYQGLGDAFVFVFFGPVGVFGAYVLLCGIPDGLVLLPAMSVGTLAVSVLNLNNMRDICSDQSASKNTLPVRFGLKFAKRYHLFLLAGSILFASLYLVLNPVKGEWSQWLFLLILPILYRQMRNIWTVGESQLYTLDPYLKQLALTTLIFVVLFLLGHFLSF